VRKKNKKANMQLELFDEQFDGKITLEELFEAYFECRKNKRRTVNAQAFEVDYETKLVELWRDINSGNYQLGRSIAFVVKKPVYREVFAADFRDRIVHHLIIRKLNPLFEAEFIENSYSCRAGKGTLYGVKNVAEFVRRCSPGYTKDCYILKMDIQSFFMSIEKKRLFAMLKKFIQEKYREKDRNLVVELVRKIVMNCPEQNCVVKGDKKNWDMLPPSKSLFFVGVDKGQPIGNLTSQVFANFYLDGFDKFVTKECGVRYYGRYVDDFVIVHDDKEFLLGLRAKMADFLWKNLGLKLHPRKVYLQHYSKGVKFVGAVVKPYRILVGKRTKGNFYNKVQEFNRLFEVSKMGKKRIAWDVVASLNSYLGFMLHYKTFGVRKRIVDEVLMPVWQRYMFVPDARKKVGVKEFYRPKVVEVEGIRRRFHLVKR